MAAALPMVSYVMAIDIWVIISFIKPGVTICAFTDVTLHGVRFCRCGGVRRRQLHQEARD